MERLKSLQRLVASLRRLPGAGPKQAERMAIHLLKMPEEQARELLSALSEARSRIALCRQCFNYSENALCRICLDESRDSSLLCVVEEPPDVSAVERSRGYKGLYHVLHGCFSPLDGGFPHPASFRALLERVGAGGVAEVILTTDPDTEGEATALYIAGELKGLPVKVTRIAHGVPLGGDLDYTDEWTLSQALTGRREM